MLEEKQMIMQVFIRVLQFSLASHRSVSVSCALSLSLSGTGTIGPF